MSKTILCSKRWMIFCMGVWFGAMCYMLSSNMSVAIVSMIKQQSRHTEDYQHETSTKSNLSVLSLLSYNDTGEEEYLPVNSTIGYELLSVQLRNGTLPYHINKEENGKCTELVRNNSPFTTGEFTWTKRKQSFVLSGYYYGYMLTQVTGGWLSGRFGGKHVIGTCIGITSGLTLLIPLMARTSAYLVVVARVLMGISSGASTPGWYMLIGVWALPHERSRFTAALWFGHVLGIVLGYSSAGFLCAHGFDNGWASVFYVHGVIGFLFVVFWWYIVYNSPKQHPRISDAERCLLERNIQTPVEKKSEKSKVPWKKILTYGPVWVIFITHVCDNWIYYLCLTCLPLYMKEVLKFDIQSNGIFSSLPFLTMMVAIAFSAVLADFFRSKQILKVTTIRKLFQVTGLLGVAAFIIVPGYLDCSLREIVIVCICLCLFFESFGCVGGHTCVAVDLSPRYASIIFGISNTMASLPGILAPLIVAELTKNQTSSEWKIVFYISAAVSIFAAVIFGVFASSELATWAKETETEVQIPLKASDD